MKAKGHINGSLVLIAIILLLVAGITYAATQIQRDDIGGSFVVGKVQTPQETILLYDELGPSTSDLVELSFGTGDFDAFSSGPHHQDSGEAKIRESTAGVSRKPSSDGKARGCSSKHLCGLTAWNT